LRVTSRGLGDVYKRQGLTSSGITFYTSTTATGWGLYNTGGAWTSFTPSVNSLTERTLLVAGTPALTYGNCAAIAGGWTASAEL
jgi:hypothetical protein